MRSLPTHLAHHACLAVLGVFLATCLGGGLCAQGVLAQGYAAPGYAPQGYVAQGPTIQRLPLVVQPSAAPTTVPSGGLSGGPWLRPASNYSPNAAPNYYHNMAPTPNYYHNTTPSYYPNGAQGYYQVTPNSYPYPSYSNSHTAPVAPGVVTMPFPPVAGNQAALGTPSGTPGDVPGSVDTQGTAGEDAEGKDGKAGDEKEEEDSTPVGLLPPPLTFTTTNEHLLWVNEVTPSSMLVRTTRFLSQYVGEWEGNLQLGLDGTSGSSETFNAAFGAEGKRMIEDASFEFDLDYKRNNSDGVITADRLFFNCRYENLFWDGRWLMFVQDEVTYDEFQPWNVQVAVSSGLGYYLRKEERSKLQALLGVGFSQDIGGPDEEYVPELHLGLQGEHSFNKRQKLTSSCNYYPDMTDFGRSRIVSKIGWEVLLDEEVNLSLKFDINERIYCPNPGGKQNDLDYAILLMWKF